MATRRYNRRTADVLLVQPYLCRVALQTGQCKHRSIACCCVSVPVYFRDEMLSGFLQEGAVLPDRGKAVTDQQIAEDMLADLEEQRPDIVDQQ